MSGAVASSMVEVLDAALDPDTPLTAVVGAMKQQPSWMMLKIQIGGNTFSVRGGTPYAMVSFDRFYKRATETEVVQDVSVSFIKLQRLLVARVDSCPDGA